MEGISDSRRFQSMMAQEHIASFLPAICAGLGLFLVGLTNLLLLRKSFAIRAGATLGATAITLAAAQAIGQPGVVATTAGYLAIGIIPILALGSRRLVSAIASTFAAAGRPALRFSLLTIAGVTVAIGSIVAFDWADELDTGGITELEMLYGSAPTHMVEHGQAATDRGTVIALKEPVDSRDQQVLSNAEEHYLQSSQFDEVVIRYGSVDDRVNCHGWVFAGGRYILTGANVGLILEENGYREQKNPAPGDLVVYRDLDVITHTAIVQYVTNGLPVMVKGKWGTLGVFLHEADKSPYGTDFKFYRSPRSGHTLAGIVDGPPVRSIVNRTIPSE